MKIYWYWPHPHRRASPLALAALRPGDELTVQALPSLHGERFPPIDEYRVVRDLPDPSLRVGGIARAIRPARIALGRARARRRLLREGFDVAHLELLTYETDWLDLRTLASRPSVVANVHDVRPHRHRWPHALETAALRALYSPAVADVLVVYHDVLRDELVADFGVGEERVAVVPLPILYDDDEPSFPEGESSEPARPSFLFFGTLRGNKGIRTLLDAARILPRDPGFDLVIAGTGAGEIEHEVTATAERLPWVEARVGRFISDEEKLALFARASVTVLPYERFHSQSGVLADAYRCGVPLIVTSVGALGATVADDRSGWVVAPADPEALAALLSEVAVSDLSAVRERVRLAAHRHDATRVGPELRRIYDLAASVFAD